MVRPLLVCLALVAAPACDDKKSESAEGKAADVKWPEKPTDGSNMVVEVLSHDNDSAELRVFNFADKAVSGLHVLQHFDDASGKELDSFPFSQSAATVVAPKGVAEIKTVMMGVPAEMKTVRVTLRRIEYAGGEEWKTKAD